MAVELAHGGGWVGQFRRETGTGTITDLKPGGRNTQVIIKADHANLREPVAGWADTTDVELMATIGKAHAEGRRIGYMIDVHRKPSADPDLPIADVGNRDKVRDLVELYLVDGNGVPIDHTPNPDRAALEAGPGEEPPAHARPATRPVEDVAATEPTATERLGLTPGAQVCPRCDLPFGTLPMVRNPDGPGRIHMTCPTVDGDVDVDAQAAAAAEAAAVDAGPVIGAGDPPHPSDGQHPVDDLNTPGSAPDSPPDGLAAPSATSDLRRGPRVEELKPWQAFYPDGRVNLGSYAYTAAVGMTELATRLIIDRTRTDSAARGVEVEAPRPLQVKALASTLLKAADRVQASTRPDGRADRMDMSHTRARGAVRSALDSYPVPWGATPEARAAWVDDLVAFGAMVLSVALSIVDDVAEEVR